MLTHVDFYHRLYDEAKQSTDDLWRIDVPLEYLMSWCYENSPIPRVGDSILAFDVEYTVAKITWEHATRIKVQLK